MNISATQSSLEKFLEVKRAAEQRMQQAEKARSATSTRESFFDIIKSARKKDDNMVMAAQAVTAAPKTVKTTAAAVSSSKSSDGLLSVYGMNSFLAKSLSETPAREALQKTKHLGNFFDAVA